MSSTPDPADPTRSVVARLLDRSIPWHTAAGWVVVAYLAIRYPLYAAISLTVLLHTGKALPPIDPITPSDALALASLPLVGVVVQKVV